MNELFLYATYQKYESKSETKKKLIALINQEKKKVDMKAAAHWICENIRRNQIKFGMSKTTRVSSVKEKMNKSAIKTTEGKLPPVRGTVNEKLQEELKFLIEIFEEMEK